MQNFRKRRIASELQGQPVSSRSGDMPCMTCASQVGLPAGCVLHGLARTPTGGESGWYIDGVYCDDHRKTRVPDGKKNRRDAAIAVKIDKRHQQYYAEKVRVKQVLEMDETGGYE